MQVLLDALRMNDYNYLVSIAHGLETSSEIDASQVL